MFMKPILIQGIIAGILASIAGIIYLNIYNAAFGVDYSAIINVGSILGACMIGCMLISLGYAVLLKTNKLKLRGWFNTLVAVLSFVSIISPMGMSLPLDIEFPELFPGLVVPMHFFPALAYFTIQPFFDIKKTIQHD